VTRGITFDRSEFVTRVGGAEFESMTMGDQLMFDSTETMRAAKLAEAFYAGRLSRRQLFETAFKLGVGAAALGAAVTTPGFGLLSASAQAAGELIVSADGDIDTTDPHISQLIVFNNMIRFNVFAVWSSTRRI